MLDVRHLEVWYGITEVLRDVSFTVPAQRIVALLGGNGSGKSTLVNTVSGLHSPRAGQILVDGQDATRAPADRMVRLGVVQIPQGREVFADMTVLDNLELGAAVRRDKQAIRADLEDVFSLFSVLKERRSMQAGALSGGEQTQLAIGRALMARPRLLLMDEPSVGLAPRVVEILIEAVRALRARGLTILLVEQNVGVAAAVADEAHVLRDGVVAYSTRARDL
ncbi:MAG TPA: ABC transporter ATP-binding protein, partial [Candidatus Methylomirabilis sp.]|nr:ABC transporter ATP-binding protein [Candidatus Methylomirabilis sp.]